MVRLSFVLGLLLATLPVLAADLPADVLAVITENQKALAAIQQQAEEQVKARNEQTKTRLEKLLASYTQAGKLDEALAVREALRNFRFYQELQGEPDPGTLTAWRSQVGDVLMFEVVGSKSGSIWGTGVYTHDSNLATAAVHAGVLKVNEKGIVKVTILPAQSSFPATGQFGVASSSWSGSVYDCYKVERARPEESVLPGGKVVLHKEIRPAPANLQGYRDQVGHAFLFEVTGDTVFSIYGTEIYSDDSRLSTAAVHAGCVVDGRKALVKVTILGPQEKFTSSGRNGVISTTWGPSSGSYKVELADKSIP